MVMRRKYCRTKVTAAESAELWERWKKGEGFCGPNVACHAHLYSGAGSLC
jgi:hypothetical protein